MPAKKYITDEVSIRLIKDLYQFYCVEAESKCVEVEAVYFYFIKYKDENINKWVDKWDYHLDYSIQDSDNRYKIRKIQREVKKFTDGEFLDWLYKKKKTRNTLLQLVLHLYPDPTLFIGKKDNKEKLIKKNQLYISYENWTANKMEEYFSKNRVIIPFTKDKYIQLRLDFKSEEYQEAIDKYIANSVHQITGNQLSYLTIKRPRKRKGGMSSTTGEYCFIYYSLVESKDKKKVPPKKINIRRIELPDFFSLYKTYFYKSNFFEWYSVTGLAWVKYILGELPLEDTKCKKEYYKMTYDMRRYDDGKRKQYGPDDKCLYIKIKEHVFRLENTVINAYIARKLE